MGCTWEPAFYCSSTLPTYYLGPRFPPLGTGPPADQEVNLAPKKSTLSLDTSFAPSIRTGVDSIDAANSQDRNRTPPCRSFQWRARVDVVGIDLLKPIDNAANVAIVAATITQVVYLLMCLVHDSRAPRSSNHPSYPGRKHSTSWDRSTKHSRSTVAPFEPGWSPFIQH